MELSKGCVFDVKFFNQIKDYVIGLDIFIG